MPETTKPCVQIDSSEFGSSVPRLLAAMDTIICETADLAVADYVFADVGIERKSALDFLNSIRDRRLFSQAKLMAASFKSPILILEGRLDDLQHKFEDEALLGALSYLCIIERLTVIPTRNEEHTARLIARMAGHRTNGLGYEVQLHASKPAATQVMQRYVVEALPGIGGGRALKLLQHFGSVRGVFTATEAQLAEVPGIGPKVAAKIVEIVSSNYRT